ncbi:unnamed protein product [marine sediment metagenome]|uniref:Macroglobulin domain-containing protein n=1 Tax=marine sediment metagenome TaxID=412755 RepID=X1ASN7_9ZZZZ
MGFSAVGYVDNDNQPLKEIEGWSSHSSPYYFPTNRSTPLMTEVSEEINSDLSPKLAYNYYNNDNVLTLNLDKSVLMIGETLTLNLGLTSNLSASSGKIISVEIYEGFYRDYYYYYPSYYETTTPIYVQNLTTNVDGQTSMTFSSTSSEGMYTVYAYSEGCRTYKDFTIGEVGIFYKGPRYYKPNQQYSAAVHVVNLRTW